jgi:hypothetical protein
MRQIVAVLVLIATAAPGGRCALTRAFVLSLALLCAAPAGWAADACALITTEDVTAATGRKDFGHARPKDGGTSCRYASSRGSVTVWVVESQTRKDFDGFHKLLADQGKRVEEVSGVGDAAYFWDDRLYVQVGTHGLTVQVAANELQPAAPGATRPAVIALARKGADRLR